MTPCKHNENTPAEQELYLKSALAKLGCNHRLLEPHEPIKAGAEFLSKHNRDHWEPVTNNNFAAGQTPEKARKTLRNYFPYAYRRKVRPLKNYLKPDDYRRHTDYHNPHNIPFSELPDGWRFLTKAEIEDNQKYAVKISTTIRACSRPDIKVEWTPGYYMGDDKQMTYIVPFHFNNEIRMRRAPAQAIAARHSVNLSTPAPAEPDDKTRLNPAQKHLQKLKDELNRTKNELLEFAEENTGLKNDAFHHQKSTDRLVHRVQELEEENRALKIQLEAWRPAIPSPSRVSRK